MNISVVIVVVLLITGIIIWRNSMKAREYAIYTAKKIANQWDVQLLDDTVCLTKTRVSRQSDVGSMCLFREYAFEYSCDGVDRYKALLQFNGNQFIQVISSDQRLTLQEIHTTKAASHDGRRYSNNIVDLTVYRKQEKKSPESDNNK